MATETENYGYPKPDVDDFYDVGDFNRAMDMIDGDIKGVEESLSSAIDTKVDKISGKGLSTNDYTTAEKNKLAGVAANANNYSLPAASASARGGVKTGYAQTGKNYPVQLSNEQMYVNVPWTDTQKITGVKGNAESSYRTGNVNVTPANIGAVSTAELNSAIGTKVDKVSGKGLSTNDYTTAEKTKLAGVAANANNYALPAASASTRGGVKTGYAQTGKNYPVQLSNEQMYVNVPWTDTQKVTGVKGNAESSYRSGNVNITAANIGAAESSIYGSGSISLGVNNVANRFYSQAFGEFSKASGSTSVARGLYSEASGDLAHAEGYFATASNIASHASGKYNKAMTAGGNYGTQVGDVFVIGNGTSDTAKSNALRVTYKGDIYGTKAFQSSGADYAEFIKPWADGNPDGEDRIGYFVTVRNGLLEKAKQGDYIAGITSGNPSIVGNADEDYYWRYERDEFNRIVMEDVPETIQQTDEDGNLVFDEDTHRPVMVETGKIIKNARMKLAEGYDPSLQKGYIERKDRKEWDYVGMLGVLPVRDDGTCLPDHFCKCSDDGIATLATEMGFYTYRVLERISENIVSVILR